MVPIYLSLHLLMRRTIRKHPTTHDLSLDLYIIKEI